MIRGPGWEISDLESNRIIGENQALKALELYNASSFTPVQGKIDIAQRYWDITKTIVEHEGEKVKLCAPAMVS
jgi:neutral ceramidase